MLTIRLLSARNAPKNSGKMKKPVIALLLMLMVTALSDIVLVRANSPSNPSVLSQPTSPSQAAPSVKSSSLPSPLTVAAWIIVLVAVFGALLSFCLRGRRTSQTENKRVGERFWAID
ncbi:MAG: hypothetical protein ABSF44_14635 [Candidatus Bathyarchaeia archaeon]|jgi:H+/gluconate symporter-like permease